MTTTQHHWVSIANATREAASLRFSLADALAATGEDRPAFRSFRCGCQLLEQAHTWDMLSQAMEDVCYFAGLSEPWLPECCRCGADCSNIRVPYGQPHYCEACTEAIYRSRPEQDDRDPGDFIEQGES